MFESETVELFGQRQVQVHRAGQGPTIVWLHGPHGVRKHDPVIAELAKHHTVIAPVAPGFNNVDELDEVRDVHDLALHYDDLFEALRLDGISLIGHSFGGMIAAEVAAHVPKRVARLVLISPFGLWRDDHPVTDLFARPYATIDRILWKTGEPSDVMADPANFPNDPVEKAVAITQAMTSVAKFIWPIPGQGIAPPAAARDRQDPRRVRRRGRVCAVDLRRRVRLGDPGRAQGGHRRCGAYGAL
jgi:pimeloyl-ACP methyl ester carboxylesterase